MRERLEAERDTLRHRLDQVNADLVDIDRALGTRAQPAPKPPITRIAETVVKRSVGGIPDRGWSGSLVGAIKHVTRERSPLARGDLVSEVYRITGKSYDLVQSNISMLARQGALRLEGPRGDMTVYYLDEMNGAAAEAH